MKLEATLRRALEVDPITPIRTPCLWSFWQNEQRYLKAQVKDPRQTEWLIARHSGSPRGDRRRERGCGA